MVSASVITDEGESYDYVGIYAPTVIAEDDYYVAAGNTRTALASTANRAPLP